MAGEIDVKKLAMALSEQLGRRQASDHSLPTGRDAGRSSSPTDARAAQQANQLLQERVKLTKELAETQSEMLDTQKKLNVEEAATRRSTETVRDLQKDIGKIEKELLKTERQFKTVNKRKTEDAREHAKALREQMDRGKQILADQKRQRDEMIKAGRESKKNFNQARQQNAKLAQQSMSARQKLNSARQMSQQLRNLQPGQQSSTANVLAGQNGFGRQALDTFRSFKDQQRQASLRQAMGDVGKPPTRTAMMRNAMSSSGMGAGGGAVGNVLSGFAEGGWGGAAVSVAKEGAKMAIDADDKLLKLSANYLKFSNKIPTSTGDAIVSLQDFEHQFKDSYVSVLDDTKGMGVGFQDAYDRLSFMSRAFRPQGEDMKDVLSKLSSDSFKFAASMGQSSEAISQSMEEDFRKFGSSAKKVSTDMAEVYETITDANRAFGKDLGQSIIRMDEFSDIIFSSARRADLWSLNYGEVAKLLTTIATEGTKAGLGEEKRQQMAKGLTDFTMGHQDTYLNVKAGERILNKFNGMGGGTDLDAIREEMGKRGDIDKQQIAGLSIALKRRRSGGNASVNNELAAKASAGSKLGMEAQLEALQKDFLDRIGTDEGKTKLLNQKLNLNDEVLASQLVESLKSGDIAKAMKQLGGPSGAAAGAAYQGKAAQGGLTVNEFAARGVVDSFGNLAAATAELTKVTITAGHAIDLMAASFGSDDAKKRLAERESLRAKQATMSSPAMLGESKAVRELYDQNSTLNPAQEMNSGLFSTTDLHQYAKDQRGRISTDSVKMFDLMQKSGGAISQNDASKIVSTYNDDQDQQVSEILASDASYGDKIDQLQKLGVPKDVIDDLVRMKRAPGKAGVAALMRESRGQPTPMPAPTPVSGFSEMSGNMSSIQSQAPNMSTPTLQISSANGTVNALNDTGEFTITGKLVQKNSEKAAAENFSKAASSAPQVPSGQ